MAVTFGVEETCSEEETIVEDWGGTVEEGGRGAKLRTGESSE